MNILLSLREFIKKEKVGLYLAELNKSQNLDVVQLKQLQLIKLKSLLEHLRKNIPFYKVYLDAEKYKKIVSANTIEEVLSNIPITDKQLIKENFNEWLSLEYSNKKFPPAIYTSGSTGTPFMFYVSAESSDVKQAAKSRLLKWHGVNRGQKQYCFMGLSASNSCLNKIKIVINNNLVWRRFNIDSTTMNYEDEIKRINEGRPVTIYGYPSSLYEIAKYSLDNDKPIRNDKLKMIIFSGESHTKHVKDTVEKAFKLKPLDEYCSNEGFIAGTCEHGNLHLFEDILIAEIIDEHGRTNSTGKGELLLTHLHTKDFPFIKYKTGDIVEISERKCECGRPFKILESVDGRKGAYVFNGTQKISDAALNVYVTRTGYIDKIFRYQIIQNEISSVKVIVVPVNPKENFIGFESKMRKLFNQIDIDFEYVNHIPKEKSGKFRVLINNI